MTESPEMSHGTTTVEAYLDALRAALGDADPALIQDALYDAEEYLRNELAERHASHPDEEPRAALSAVVAKFGEPTEVAQEFRDAESRLPVRPPPPATAPRRSAARRFFGVVGDARAWTSLIFMFLSLGTGIAYFTWVVTGASLAVGLLVLIVGIPILGLFLASLRVVALVEGRLVEALLGVRMPRRPFLTQRGQGWLAQLKGWLTEGHTWATFAYCLLMLPLGILYFTIFTTLCSVALSALAAPILHFGFDLPLGWYGGAPYTLEDWAVALLPVAGLLAGLLILHLARGIGHVHGRFAKALLVRA